MTKKTRIISWIVILSITAFFIGTCISKQAPVEEQKQERTLIEVKIDAEAFIEMYLKSPSTADFNWSTKGVKQLNDTLYNVSGYVDSQNGFGAMIRSKYYCTIWYSDEIVNCSDVLIY